jgi:hypothetical protein
VKPRVTLEEARVRHAADVATFGEVLADLEGTLRGAVDSIRTCARVLAGVAAVVEQGQRDLLLQAAAINEAATAVDASRVLSPRLLEEFLAGLSPELRNLYQTARLGPDRAARALADLVEK